MNKIRTKLIASLLSVVIAAALIVVSTYAWLTISTETEVGGINIQIGGSNTIKLAADIVVDNGDGTFSHYPGAFSENLNFSDYETYRYLTELGALSPVSTYDGIHWVLPDFYQESDPLVQQGMAVAGQLKDYSLLPVDNTLQYANLTNSQQNSDQKGSYVYLDFWVVSPSGNCELRISTGNDSNTGSFVIGEMTPVMNAQGTGYELKAGEVTAAASVRLGFLTNQENAAYTDIQKYLGSADYSKTYTHLLGRFQEPGQTLEQYTTSNWFTIYEPNGNLHTDGGKYYQITNPLRVLNGTIEPADISQHLAVQLTNYWKVDPFSGDVLLAREFLSATFNMQDKSREEVSNYFYNHYMQSAFASFVDRGYFVDSTRDLYAEADANGIVPDSSTALHNTDRATDEIVITTLQKNVPQRIRMFVWLEGQDADCVNIGDISNLIINLEFAGNG